MRVWKKREEKKETSGFHLLVEANCFSGGTPGEWEKAFQGRSKSRKDAKPDWPRNLPER